MENWKPRFSTILIAALTFFACSLLFPLEWQSFAFSITSLVVGYWVGMTLVIVFPRFKRKEE